MNLRLHIDRLILDGLPLPPGSGSALQAAVEAELARLLSEGGLSPALQAGGALPVLNGGNIQLRQPGSPAQLGTQIARAVYEGIGQK